MNTNSGHCTCPRARSKVSPGSLQVHTSIAKTSLAQLIIRQRDRYIDRERTLSELTNQHSLSFVKLLLLSCPIGNFMQLFYNAYNQIVSNTMQIIHFYKYHHNVNGKNLLTNLDNLHKYNSGFYLGYKFAIFIEVFK